MDPYYSYDFMSETSSYHGDDYAETLLESVDLPGDIDYHNPSASQTAALGGGIERSSLLMGKMTGQTGQRFSVISEGEDHHDDVIAELQLPNVISQEEEALALASIRPGGGRRGSVLMGQKLNLYPDQLDGAGGGPGGPNKLPFDPSMLLQQHGTTSSSSSTDNSKEKGKYDARFSPGSPASLAGGYRDSDDVDAGSVDNFDGSRAKRNLLKAALKQKLKREAAKRNKKSGKDHRIVMEPHHHNSVRNRAINQRTGGVFFMTPGKDSKSVSPGKESASPRSPKNLKVYSNLQHATKITGADSRYRYDVIHQAREGPPKLKDPGKLMSVSHGTWKISSRKFPRKDIGYYVKSLAQQREGRALLEKHSTEDVYGPGNLEFNFEEHLRLRKVAGGWQPVNLVARVLRRIIAHFKRIKKLRPSAAGPVENGFTINVQKAHSLRMPIPLEKMQSDRKDSIISTSSAFHRTSEASFQTVSVSNTPTAVASGSFSNSPTNLFNRNRKRAPVDRDTRATPSGSPTSARSRSRYFQSTMGQQPQNFRRLSANTLKKQGNRSSFAKAEGSMSLWAKQRKKAFDDLSEQASVSSLEGDNNNSVSQLIEGDPLLAMLSAHQRQKQGEKEQFRERERSTHECDGTISLGMSSEGGVEHSIGDSKHTSEFLDSTFRGTGRLLPYAQADIDRYDFTYQEVEQLDELRRLHLMEQKNRQNDRQNGQNSVALYFTEIQSVLRYLGYSATPRVIYETWEKCSFYQAAYVAQQQPNLGTTQRRMNNSTSGGKVVTGSMNVSMGYDGRNDGRSDRDGKNDRDGRHDGRNDSRSPDRDRRNTDGNRSQEGRNQENRGPDLPSIVILQNASEYLEFMYRFRESDREFLLWIYDILKILGDDSDSDSDATSDSDDFDISHSSPLNGGVGRRASTASGAGVVPRRASMMLKTANSCIMEDKVENYVPVSPPASAGMLKTLKERPDEWDTADLPIPDPIRTFHERRGSKFSQQLKQAFGGGSVGMGGRSLTESRRSSYERLTMGGLPGVEQDTFDSNTPAPTLGMFSDLSLLRTRRPSVVSRRTSIVASRRSSSLQKCFQAAQSRRSSLLNGGVMNISSSVSSNLSSGTEWGTTFSRSSNNSAFPNTNPFGGEIPGARHEDRRSSLLTSLAESGDDAYIAEMNLLYNSDYNIYNSWQNAMKAGGNNGVSLSTLEDRLLLVLEFIGCDVPDKTTMEKSLLMMRSPTVQKGKPSMSSSIDPAGKPVSLVKVLSTFDYFLKFVGAYRCLIARKSLYSGFTQEERMMLTEVYEEVVNTFASDKASEMMSNGNGHGSSSSTKWNGNRNSGSSHGGSPQQGVAIAMNGGGGRHVHHDIPNGGRHIHYDMGSSNTVAHVASTNTLTISPNLHNGGAANCGRESTGSGYRVPPPRISTQNFNQQGLGKSKSDKSVLIVTSGLSSPRNSPRSPMSHGQKMFGVPSPKGTQKASLKNMFLDPNTIPLYLTRRDLIQVLFNMGICQVLRIYPHLLENFLGTRVCSGFLVSSATIGLNMKNNTNANANCGSGFGGMNQSGLGGGYGMNQSPMSSNNVSFGAQAVGGFFPPPTPRSHQHPHDMHMRNQPQVLVHLPSANRFMELIRLLLDASEHEEYLIEKHSATNCNFTDAQVSDLRATFVYYATLNSNGNLNASHRFLNDGTVSTDELFGLSFFGLKQLLRSGLEMTTLSYEALKTMREIYDKYALKPNIVLSFSGFMRVIHEMVLSDFCDLQEKCTAIIKRNITEKAKTAEEQRKREESSSSPTSKRGTLMAGGILVSGAPGSPSSSRPDGPGGPGVVKKPSDGAKARISGSISLQGGRRNTLTKAIENVLQGGSSPHRLSALMAPPAIITSPRHSLVEKEKKAPRTVVIVEAEADNADDMNEEEDASTKKETTEEFIGWYHIEMHKLDKKRAMYVARKREIR